MRRAEHITSRLGFVLVATLVAVLFACMPAASFAEHGVTSPPSARTSSAEIDSVTPLPSDWLDRVNRIREIGDIPAVAEDPSMSDGCFKHARYMAENDWIGHDEDPANPWYTPEGRTAAQQSNCYLGIGGVAAIDGWVRSPFHGIGVLDPELHTIGFGTYTTAGGRSAAALNVLGGRGATSVSFPLLWPGDGQEMPYLSYPGYESPNPLAGTAWTLPVGAPVYAQFGAGSANPVVTASRLSAGGADLEHMVLTEFTYTNPDSTQQSLGRLILGSRDAVVILPRQPLVAEKRYDVNLTVNGQDYAWSFYTSDRTPPMTTASMRGDGTRRVDITLSASDAGSGVAVTEYSVDGTGTQTYAGTLSFDQTGDHTIEYWSEDVAGNVERSSSLAFAVGTADPPPLVTVPERLAGNSRYTTAVRIARESFDPAGDGSWPEVRDVIIASGEDRAA
ncbi:MAG: CAP domain-containing protein, partial [Coriobacteriia bacterium]|nr:CAP domain-containing protein [Coriobacteriia bacterium]